MKLENAKLNKLGYTRVFEIRPSTNPNKIYRICYGKGLPQRYEHVLIYETEIGPIPEGYVVHHKDHDGLNNDPSNLECMSRSHHMITHGRKLMIDGRYYTLKEACKEFGWKDKGNLIRSVDAYIERKSNRSSWAGHEVHWE